MGEGVEADREGVVHAGPAEGDLVGAACLLEALGSEGFREGGGDDPAAQFDLSGAEHRHQRERCIRVIVVEALWLRLEGELGGRPDALGHFDGLTVGQLGLRAQGRVAVVGIDAQGEAGSGLEAGVLRQQVVGDGGHLVGAFSGLRDQHQLEFAERLGVVPAFAFGDDHGRFLLVQGGHEPAGEQQQQTAVDHAHPEVAQAALEVTQVREREVDDKQRTE